MCRRIGACGRAERRPTVVILMEGDHIERADDGHAMGYTSGGKCPIGWFEPLSIGFLVGLEYFFSKRVASVRSFLLPATTGPLLIACNEDYDPRIEASVAKELSLESRLRAGVRDISMVSIV